MHRSLQGCPLYQLSPDGSVGIAPNLTKLHVTQLGYGILPSDYLEETREIYYNRGSPHDDGLYKIDLSSGDCQLFVSLRTISKAVGLPLDVPTYGFHAKVENMNNSTVNDECACVYVCVYI